jgi:hypothetical protein
MTETKDAHSITKSMLSDVAQELGLEGLFEGEMRHTSFDNPKNLGEAFKTECKDNGSSVCKELQKYELSYIVSSRIKKHALSNTISKIVDLPVTIQNLNLNQYVQSRVRRHVKIFEERDLAHCHFCGREAIGKFRYVETREVYGLCEFHAGEFVNGKNWDVAKDE